ncbi:MAG: hypothetical protein EXS29_00070 [Pedosphaera sp.]|nr:hypothetical protein [Pedosphaera sp.]MSS99699.1 hypothetical protein [Pedosphaera sp.]
MQPRTAHPLFLLGILLSFASTPASAQTAKPIPLLQAVPQPHDQISFQRDGLEIARYHFAPTLQRPFVFPLIGPSGRPVTRMGHPHDPVGHSHHNSCWISHNDVNGVSFWADRGTNTGRILHQRIERLEDSDDTAAVLALNHWVDKNGKVLLIERRRTAVQPLPGGESLLTIDLQLEPREKEATLGKTPFGIFAVRVTKTMGIHDGGGSIRNSAGNVDEQGENGCFWKAAKWCDYSGPVTAKATEGVTLLDHPTNPNHPSVFHVRADGWMGSSLTFDGPRVIAIGKPLQLRYGVYIHAGKPSLAALEQRWETFAKTAPFDFTVKRK